MAGTKMGFREIIPNQTNSPKWKELSVTTGAAQGTLQDIKRPEACGGYVYKSRPNDNGITRNRFIYWRISNDVLEIAEESLDIDLIDNHVCLRFHDTPVLDAVGIFETRNEVVILVATVSSVHRIVLHHPHKDNRILSQDRTIAPSILSELNPNQVREAQNCHVLNWSGAPGSFPHTSACWLTSDGDAYFALSNDVGNILLVQLPRLNATGTVVVKDLRQTTVMQRVWTGFVPSIIRGNSQQGDVALSLCFSSLGSSSVLLALCKDLKLRLWSMKDQNFSTEWNLIQYLNCTNDVTKYSGQRHCLKIANGIKDNEMLLGAFLYFMDQSVFIIFQLTFNNNEYRFEVIKLIYSQESDLIDFCVTKSYLWALWTNGESQPILKHCSIDRQSLEDSSWKTDTLDTLIEKDFYIPEGLMEPREAYCQYIFHPGRFSLQTITKAIHIYRRSLNSSLTSSINSFSLSALRKEVISAVELEIQHRASEYELVDDMYIVLQQECWSKFYLACIQYHQVGNKLMGLFSDFDTGLTCLIKKNSFSLLRPRDVVELLVLSNGESVMEDSLPKDVSVLYKCLEMLSNKFTPDLIHDFNHDLFHLTNPELIAEAITEGFIRMEDNDFLDKIKHVLHTIPDVTSAIQSLLSAIDLAHGAPQELVVDNLPTDANKRLLVNNLFGSALGTSLLSQTVLQTSQLRLSVCRDLLILLTILTKKDEQIRHHASELLSECVCLTQAYFLMTWVCDSVSSIYTQPLDVGMRHLAILNLSEKPSARLKDSAFTLVELFVQSDGGNLARILLSNSGFLDGLGSLWNQGFWPMTVIIAQLIWPISANFMFPEFLMTHQQYLQLQEYVRVLRPWCSWNCYSRHFLRGHTHLIQGEPDKALEWFLSASAGASQEPFIIDKVLQASDADPSQLRLMYYLKVIKLFEEFLNVEHVIKLAEIAIEEAKDGSSYLATFLTLKFKNQLELGHNNAAFAAMMSLSDHSQRRDCLKQFILVLCDRQELKSLVEYTYLNLDDDVCEILEGCARNIDLTKHNYYEVLYSFHIFRGNYRRAGSIMYEQGMRLGLEVSGLKGLQKQAKCYLGALNCLKIIDPNNAWIVKPTSQSQYKRLMVGDEEDLPQMSPKRNTDGDEIVRNTKSEQLVLVELDTIKKEYELVLARLKLIKREPDPAIAVGSPFSGEDTAILLSKACLFDAAIRICNLFNLPKQTIFESLATKCVHLSSSASSDPSVTQEAWEWLSENDLPRLHSADNKSVSEHAWRLLQSYVETYESPGQTTYHRCILVRLFSLGCHCPFWLEASYKKRDIADFLRQHLKFDMLESAAKLVMEYIDAVLGIRPDNFGLKTILSAQPASVWLPYTVIDQLLLGLNKVAQENQETALLQVSLKDKLANYLVQAEEKSREISRRALSH